MVVRTKAQINTGASPRDTNVVDLRGVASAEIDKLTGQLKRTNFEKEFLEKILQIEAGLRSQESLQALKYFTANELHSVISCAQILVMKRKRNGSAYVVDTVSNVAVPDANSPLLHWLSSEINKQAKMGDFFHGDDASKSFRLRSEMSPQSEFSASNGMIVPLKDKDGWAFGILVFLAEKPFAENVCQLGSRLGKAVSHSWSNFEKTSRGLSFGMPNSAKFLLVLGFILLGLLPVPLTVLAPMAITPDRPKLVAAPLNGVVKKIHVLPNTRVEIGDALFTYDKTDASNLLDQAERGLAIAEAKFRRANQDAFGSGSGRQDMAVAKAEYDLAIAEKNAATRKLMLAKVTAETAGIVLFDSKEKWLGKPVSIGERIMKIADPQKIKYTLDLPTQEAIILSELKTAKIFLDSDPLNPFEVSIDRASYEAKLSDANILVFPIIAHGGIDQTSTAIRIGLRGTAQISGSDVPLWFFLFRKPLSFLRQYTGL